MSTMLPPIHTSDAKKQVLHVSLTCDDKHYDITIESQSESMNLDARSIGRYFSDVFTTVTNEALFVVCMAQVALIYRVLDASLCKLTLRGKQADDASFTITCQQKKKKEKRDTKRKELTED